MKEKLIRKLANKSIKKWKNRLGFSEWKIDAKITVFKRADGFPQDGDIIVNYSKKQATILIGKILKSPAEEIIVHELVHLMLWPLDKKTILIIKRLPRSKRKRAEDDFLGKLEDAAAQITHSLLCNSVKKYKKCHGE